ncbi:two component transcriptional regulator, LuxR family [Lacrimispora sphenoides]|jgi:DNA-binding NarL/FixJ family response regulator|uniref:response regulator transcription factor n=1 Tax=Lacrimispora sphenoides TaxID=29370 RepID=UPI0008B7087F|nr:response regulator transcription factor [Lacrimispora sphenoides]SET66509.1 two component transcriptional regulator, LuxR family [Lacrimispora sphenoides]
MIKVLIAEDFTILCDDLKKQLERDEEIKVIGCATTGKEIVEMALEMAADVILMDIEMESRNAGILAAEHIRDIKHDQKIIYLTVHETEDIIITAMGTGAVDYVVKGGAIENLIEHVKNAHMGKPVMEARIQKTIMNEYKRLQRSERSLLYFINNVSQLTAAERELVKLLLEDRKIKEIAGIRCVEVITVKTQIKSLLRKFGCSRSKEIVSIIRELNLSHLFEEQTFG